MSRTTCQSMAILLDNPRGNPVPPQTPHYPKSSIVSSQYERGQAASMEWQRGAMSSRRCKYRCKHMLNILAVLLTADSMRESASREFHPRNKPHKRTKAPCCGCTY